MELTTALHYAYLMTRSRLSAAHDEEAGVTTLEIVLWTAGLGVLALATIIFITQQVTTAQNNIPTGP